MIKSILPACFCVAVGVSVSLAEGESDRFQLIEKGDQTIRLNMETGAVSFCDKTNGGLACKLAADERAVWLAENNQLSKQVDELSNRVTELEARVRSLESSGNSEADDELTEVLPETPPSAGSREEKKPADEEQAAESPSLLSESDKQKLDLALEKAEHVFRSFIGLMKDLQADFQNR